MHQWVVLKNNIKIYIKIYIKNNIKIYVKNNIKIYIKIYIKNSSDMFRCYSYTVIRERINLCLLKLQLLQQYIGLLPNSATYRHQ